ncbi:MAG: T9SS type A sorting domain-containing protein [Chlorobiota bacterium]|nr:MAG: T9SS type A sorting domain-containing protein [Chlorobiota bacterium]
MEFFNINGKKVRTDIFQTSNYYQSLTTLNNGFYFYSIKSDSKIIYRGKLLIN